MAILGMLIQTRDGKPLYSNVWSEKVIEFEEADHAITAGFLSALNSFAGEFNQKLGFIRFLPLRLYPNTLGINALVTFIEDLMIVCFTEPYLFPEKVFMKIQWIYDAVLVKYVDDLRRGHLVPLQKEDQKFIRDILLDRFLRQRIQKNKEELEFKIQKFLYDTAEEIYGISINSFDNSILYSYRIDRKQLEYMLFDMGGMGAGGMLDEFEIQYKPVWFKDHPPLLISVANSGLPTELDEILHNESTEVVHYYYYLITGTDCSIGPIMENLIHEFNPVLLTY